MIYYSGDVVEYFTFMKESKVQPHVLIHGCNCAGVFNSGIAKTIREKFPQVYYDYLKYVKTNNRTNILGNVVSTGFENNCSVVSIFTQLDYGRDPKVVYVNYKALEYALEKIKLLYKDSMIIMPTIGAGLANGDWNVIAEIIEDKLKECSFMVFKLDNFRHI